MNIKFLSAALITLGLLSSQAQASVPAPGDADYVVNTNAHVGSYNLILSEDLDYNSHIYEKILVGGDIKGGTTEVGARIEGGGVDAVVVLGDISGTVRTLKGNNILYGTKTGTTYNNDGGTSSAITNMTDAQNEFDAIWDQAVNDSAHFETLSSTGTLNSAGKFENNNSLDLNVFNIDASILADQNLSLTFDVNPTTPIIINVAGSGTININAKASGNFTKTEAAPLVLWNFYDAKGEINIAGDGWNGSVLAPLASINLTTGSLDGGLVAKSLTSDKQLHNELFTYTPPTTTPPTSEVPAPTGALIITLGLIFMGYRKFKK
ncbi:choice-of-anchor A family protein [Paraglaciecola sp. L3A3]|uniref:choice-of-anchor A family protein n=1 Tax=Paraglaciecola sp. L3A3 TaxID=2686358 RepID=UPI00131A6928|nr:choice-of-anchor A family protein [Paraglaciecola sp. L3A3]